MVILIFVLALLEGLAWATPKRVVSQSTSTFVTPAPFPTAVCSLDTFSCAECSGTTLQPANGSSYQVYCDTCIESSESFVLDTKLSLGQCLEGCEGFFQCVGVSYSDSGMCELAIGKYDGIENDARRTAFVAVNASASTATSSATTSTTSSTSSDSSKLTTTIPTSTPSASSTGPSTTFTTASSSSTASSTPTSASLCSATNITCPACDNQVIKDQWNGTYEVLCDYVLASTEDYGFGEPLPALYCLAQCDERNATCLGASWVGEECNLALGALSGPIQQPGYTAFLAVHVTDHNSTKLASMPSTSATEVTTTEVSSTSTAAA